MKQPKIIVHCLVKNEENFIWYAIMSVLPYVDKIMVWDNGSTDNTIKIIKSIRSAKIDFEEHPTISRAEVGHLRQKMLERTPSGFDWLLVLDGDEIWGDKSIKKVIVFICNHQSVESVVTKTYNLVGDIYHRLPNKFGKYVFRDKKGNFAMRFINLRIPGLHVESSYGQEGYYDAQSTPIQYRSKVAYVDTEYFHATHLLRSRFNKPVLDRQGKLKYYLGLKNQTKNIPDIFFSEKPVIVPDVTGHMNWSTTLRAFFETQLRNLKSSCEN